MHKKWFNFEVDTYRYRPNINNDSQLRTRNLSIDGNWYWMWSYSHIWLKRNETEYHNWRELFCLQYFFFCDIKFQLQSLFNLLGISPHVHHRNPSTGSFTFHFYLIKKGKEKEKKIMWCHWISTKRVLHVGLF